MGRPLAAPHAPATRRPRRGLRGTDRGRGSGSGAGGVEVWQCGWWHTQSEERLEATGVVAETEKARIEFESFDSGSGGGVQQPEQQLKRRRRRRSLSGGPLKATWNSEMLSSTSSTCQSLITAKQTTEPVVAGSRRQQGGPAGRSGGAADGGSGRRRRRRRHSSSHSVGRCLAASRRLWRHSLSFMTSCSRLQQGEGSEVGKRGAPSGVWAPPAGPSHLEVSHLREGELAAAIAVPPPQAGGVLAAWRLPKGTATHSKMLTTMQLIVQMAASLIQKAQSSALEENPTPPLQIQLRASIATFLKPSKSVAADLIAY